MSLFSLRQRDEKTPTGLKREARPQRYGGEKLDWGLQITNEKSSRLWGWRGEGTWMAEVDNKDTSNTLLAGGMGGGL